MDLLEINLSINPTWHEINHTTSKSQRGKEKKTFQWKAFWYTLLAVFQNLVSCLPLYHCSLFSLRSCFEISVLYYALYK